MVDFSLRKARNGWKNVSPRKQRGTRDSAASPPQSPRPSGQHSVGSPSKKPKDKKKLNPYANLDITSKPYTELPTINALEKNKAASSMQRRLSVHNQNYIPPVLDYSMPMPTNLLPTGINSTEQTTSGATATGLGSKNVSTNAIADANANVNATATSHLIPGSSVASSSTNLPDNYNSDTTTVPPSTQRDNLYKPSQSTTASTTSSKPLLPRDASTVGQQYSMEDLLQFPVMREVLGDPNFNAKRFIHDKLSIVSAIEIDEFTNRLTEFAQLVQVEVRLNLNKSYSEIIQVNSDLYVAASELSILRENFRELMRVMNNFKVGAEKRLTLEEEEEQEQEEAEKSERQREHDDVERENIGNGRYKTLNSDETGLLPPVRSNKTRRDRSSVFILDRIWQNELAELVKNVEGTKNILFENGKRKNNRYVKLESSDWVELNVTTLRFLQAVKIYILNDLILVAAKNKNNDYVLSQCLELKNVTVTKQPRSNRLLFKVDRRMDGATAATSMVNTNRGPSNGNGTTRGSSNSRGGSNNNNSSNGNTTSRNDTGPGKSYSAQLINGLLYEARDEAECYNVLNTIRKAKDDLLEIFQGERENEKKIKESYRYLQSSQTPVRDSGRSPVKTNRRSFGSTPKGTQSNGIDSAVATSAGGSLARSSSTSGFASGNGGLVRINSFKNRNILQNLTLSMQTTSINSMNPFSRRLKQIDENIEELDVDIARLKFSKAVDSLLSIQEELKNLYDTLDSNGKTDPDEPDDDTILCNLLLLKVDERREMISSKLSQRILFDTEISQLMLDVKTLIRLDLSEQGLDLFLQNRSKAIEDLILQISAFENAVNYLTQLAILRFQMIKQTVLNFEMLFPRFNDPKSIDNKFSSILVSWCSDEVDKHFKSIDKQLLNDEMLSPVSIKSTRKQIDELKSVGLDFVYKLDEFIKKNSHMIH